MPTSLLHTLSYILRNNFPTRRRWKSYVFRWMNFPWNYTRLFLLDRAMRTFSSLLWVYRLIRLRSYTLIYTARPASEKFTFDFLASSWRSRMIYCRSCEKWASKLKSVRQCWLDRYRWWRTTGLGSLSQGLCWYVKNWGLIKTITLLIFHSLQRWTKRVRRLQQQHVAISKKRKRTTESELVEFRSSRPSIPVFYPSWTHGTNHLYRACRTPLIFCKLPVFFRSTSLVYEYSLADTGPVRS